MPSIIEIPGTAPGGVITEPVTTVQCQAWARSRESESPNANLLVTMCRLKAEQLSGHYLAQRDFTITYDRDEIRDRSWPLRPRWYHDVQNVTWTPHPLSLAAFPVASVVSVTINDPLDNATVLDPSTYSLDSNVRPCRLRLHADALLTYVLRETAAFVIRITAGYPQGQCPEDFQVAIMRIFATNNEFREDVIGSTGNGRVAVMEVPENVRVQLQSRAIVSIA